MTTRWLARRCALIAICLSVATPAGAATHVLAGALMTGEDDRVRGPSTVIVADGRVEAVVDGHDRGGPDDTVVDLSDRFVTPGWIDMHVHIASELSPQRQLERYTLDPQDNAFRSVVYARRTLDAGFTTVRDLGTSHGLAQSLRRAVAEGWVEGPRIFTAGKAIATTGGHGDPSNGRSIALSYDAGPAAGVANGLDEVRKAVRARYKEGSDVIKITATGGVLSQARSGQNAQFTVAEVEEIVRTARDYGFRVAAHAHGTEGMLRAVEGGVDSIEHGTFMSDEVMRAMKRRGTWYVPTISAGQFVANKARIDGYFSELVRPKAASIGPLILGTFTRAYENGVRIAFGTDCGVCAHGENWREFVYMVEGGMPIEEAIVAATRSAAELLGESDDLGTLSTGKRADIVALARDPREDPMAMGEVIFVMKDGVIEKHAEP